MSFLLYIFQIQTYLKRNFNKALLAIPAILGICFILGTYKKDLVIFPGETISSYTDQLYKGTSQINDLKLLDTNWLFFSYTLDTGFKHPYVGVQFYTSSKPTFDLSEYDYIEIDLQAESSKSIPVIINLEFSNFFIGSTTVSQRPMWQELEYEKGQNVYRLPLADFRTPNWWFIYTKVTKNDIASPDYKRVTDLAIQNCQLLPVNQKESVIVKNILVGKDCYKGATAIVLMLSAFYSLVFLIVKFKQAQPVIFPHKTLNLCNIEDEETRSIINYVSENYNHTDLSLTILQKELGLTESKISSVFKKACGTTFKKYLNQVRLNEAKRLLKQTDRQIMEVAFSVGYGNVSHFNKVFKASEGCAPNEYRKIKKNR
ncbi:AraC family transcriptional regulator [Fulvivirga ulvae]|uniref:helix-turn-helix domain-containing protein n=1 Tax=Fulvivirga ulvae TaxID=2904245 RepID=UPI001F2812AC|nr:AraC family transcriptional regulator [Fulvivirga ulvae]UII29605.1 AraC family transcriptional regulator [Fulvivirga ulvae]